MYLNVSIIFYILCFLNKNNIKKYLSFYSFWVKNKRKNYQCFVDSSDFKYVLIFIKVNDVLIYNYVRIETIYKNLGIVL